MRATGKDVQALRGMLQPAADKCNERNEAANNDIGLIEMEAENGRKDTVREDQARRMEAKGYSTTTKSFLVPDLPWLKK